MTTIIAGRFQTQDEAAVAVDRLARDGFDHARLASFFVNPPGRHDQYPVGGDRSASPGAESSDAGATGGALTGGVVGVAVGVATAPLLGPGAVLAGAGVGAYAGALQGAMSRSKESAVATGEAGQRPEAELRERASGMLVAVAVDGPDDRQRALQALRELGARDIERATGTIEAGEWADFDPLRPVTLASS